MAVTLFALWLIGNLCGENPSLTQSHFKLGQLPHDLHRVDSRIWIDAWMDGWIDDSHLQVCHPSIHRSVLTFNSSFRQAVLDKTFVQKDTQKCVKSPFIDALCMAVGLGIVVLTPFTALVDQVFIGGILLLCSLLLSILDCDYSGKGKLKVHCRDRNVFVF